LLAIGDAEPWSLGSTELVGWLKEKLERVDPKRDWTALLGALSGLRGVGLLDRCEKMSNPPWVKLKAGCDGTPLIKLGIKSGQIGVLNKLLDRYGIGYYSLLLQSCDRVSPLMDLVWIEKLGEGSFGQVHLVKNKNNNTRTALKLIQVEDDQVLPRAIKEMQHHQKAAKASEFVVNICTWGQVSDDFLFVELEFCAGGDIRKTLNSAEPPGSGMADTNLRWKLYMQICRGLEAVHETGLIHMDLKPENGSLAALARPLRAG
jgi:hypothetical protein